TVSGPQQAMISFEACARELVADKPYEGKIKIVANAGQELSFSIRLGVLPARQESATQVARPVVVGVVAGLVFRLILALPADVYARALAGSPGSSASFLETLQNDPSFAKHFVMATFWLGAVLGAIVLGRMGRHKIDVICGMISGLVAGLAGTATI